MAEFRCRRERKETGSRRISCRSESAHACTDLQTAGPERTVSCSPRGVRFVIERTGKTLATIPEKALNVKRWLTLPRKSMVNLTVCNLLGQCVATVSGKISMPVAMRSDLRGALDKGLPGCYIELS